MDEKHIWIDLVHLELRLTDRTELFMQGEEAVRNKKVEELESAINFQCGLSYKSYQSKSSLNKIEWPSLPCKQKLLILDHLQKVDGFITDPSLADGFLRCNDLLRQCLAFLRCPRRLNDHEKCPHDVSTLEKLDEIIALMSESRNHHSSVAHFF